jgi:hypothetical protein
MGIKITCRCGYEDDIDMFIAVTPVRKVKKEHDGKTYHDMVYDWTFHCPQCGYTEKRISIGGRLENQEN